MFQHYMLPTGASSTFTEHPSTHPALTNSPTSLACSVHDQPPLPASIIWFKDGVAKSTDERIQISYNTTTGYSTYQIHNVLYADQGNYTCRAYNASESLLFVSNTGTLTIIGIPAFDPPLQPQTVSTGSTVTINCDIISNPVATEITWEFDGVVLSNSVQYAINGQQITILNVQSFNDGYYTCTAKNMQGTNSTSAKLTVQCESVVKCTIIQF